MDVIHTFDGHAAKSHLDIADDVVNFLGERGFRVHEFQNEDRDDGAPYMMWTLVVEDLRGPLTSGPKVRDVEDCRTPKED